jgi:hypothetical protein
VQGVGNCLQGGQPVQVDDKKEGLYLVTQSDTYTEHFVCRPKMTPTWVFNKLSQLLLFGDIGAEYGRVTRGY